jgi:molybdopterin/thiamine biosynthesis adenylyltransferase
MTDSLTPEELDRYDRQIRLYGFEAQSRYQVCEIL